MCFYFYHQPPKSWW